jgi:hypothetical protein
MKISVCNFLCFSCYRLIVTAEIEEQLKAQNESPEISAMLEEYIHELYVYEICNNSFISLCYRDSRHIIVGSIQFLGMCLINPMKMDGPHNLMSVSSQITLITERSQSSQELVYFSLLLQRLNSYNSREHPYSCDVFNKSQENGCSPLSYVSVISNYSGY